MIYQYVSMLSKSTAGIRRRCLLINYHGCLPYYYSSDRKDTRPPGELQKYETENPCKQFTSIAKLFNGVTRKTHGTSNKISIIGLDESSVATIFALVSQNISDNICMIDLDDDVLKGEYLDLKMSGLYNYNAKIIASKDPAATANSKVCIIFTGTYRGKGEDPAVYVARNIGIIRALIPGVVRYSPATIIIIASPPVDILSYASWKISGLPKSHIIGTGTLIDTARFRCLLSQKMKISPIDCNAYIIGEHGENSVPVWSCVNVAGVPIKDVNLQVGTNEDPEDWNEIFKEVVNSDETIRCLKGYNSWAYASAIANLCNAVVNNLNTVLPVSTYVKGQHAIREDVFLSLPCVIGENGVTDILRQKLSDYEIEKLHKCAENVANLQTSVEIIT